MPLVIDNILWLLTIRAPEEMIESHFIEGCCRGVSGDMPAYAFFFPVCLNYHSHSIPANEAFDLPFNLPVAGIRIFLAGRYCVDIGSIELAGQADSFFIGLINQKLQYLPGPSGTFMFNDI